MNVTTTDLPGVLIIEPKVFSDARGFFLETYIRTGNRLSSMYAWYAKPQRAQSGERVLVQIATQER